MLALDLLKNGAAPLKILCLGSHSDDIEIGCGGTILRLLSGNPNLEIVWVVFSSTKKEREAKHECGVVPEAGEPKEIIVKDFRDGFFPFDGPQIKEILKG